MAFIKTQKLVYDEKGNITSGSAAIMDTIYGKFGSYHAKHTVRERLGKVVFLSEDKKSGVFLSPTRGLVQYDVESDSFSPVSTEDARVSGTKQIPPMQIHTVFGDAYLLLRLLEKTGLMAVLRDVFPKDSDFERVLCHVLHGILRDGSRIGCDNFMEKSFASYLVPHVILPSLKSDSRFYSMMGDDRVRIAFFRGLIASMRRKHPAFGKGCYVDSTPLPNDIGDNPFNALCCHGISSSEVMMRLVLVIDEETGLPVWYDIIPGNVLDINTVKSTMEDVQDSLGIRIDSMVLDAGYVSKELVTMCHIGTEKSMIGRMPARKGYPYKTLYWEVKDLIGKGKYAFARKHHAYFGKRKDIELFGCKEFAYVYVDQYNALKRFSDYLVEHAEEFADLLDRDKDWMTVKYGYFILISNQETTPEILLSDYFGRTEIETIFKTSKEYLRLLPLSKWTDQTVRGKILHDVLDTIITLLLRKELAQSGISLSELFGKTQSLMCFRNSSGMVTTETPNKKVKEYYAMFHQDIPSHLQIDELRKNLLSPKM